jgi:hypothetical protein
VPSGWQSDPVTVSVDASDDDTGVDRIEYCTGAGCDPSSGSTGDSVTVSQDGTTQVRFRAVDNVGNSGPVQTATVKIDRSGPSVDVDTGARGVGGGWSNTPVTVDMSGSDSQSGLDRVEHCLGASCSPGSGGTGGSVTVDQEGTTQIQFRGVDELGNAGSTDAVTVQIDTSAPAPTVAATKQGSGESYDGGWSSEPVELGVDCADQDDLSGCDTGSDQLRLVGSPGVCPGEGDRFATDTYGEYDVATGRVLDDGTYYVCAASQDRAANVGFGGASPDAREIQVDATDPDVDASADSPTNDRQEPVTYTVNESNLDACSASGAGVSWSCSESDNNNDGVYEGRCDPQSDMAEGDHNVTVSCTDLAGNTGDDTTDMVVDTTHPDVECNDCAQPNPVRNRNEIEFDPTVSDPTSNGVSSGVGLVEICEDADCTDTYCSTTAGPSCTYITPENTADSFEYWVRATDEAGNTADPVGPNEFEVKKWVGQSCTTDDACLLGACTEDPETGRQTCEATVIPEPGIILEQ